MSFTLQLDEFNRIKAWLERVNQENGIPNDPPAYFPDTLPSTADLITLDDLLSLPPPAHRTYQPSIIPGVYIDLTQLAYGDLAIKWKNNEESLWFNRDMWSDGVTVPGEADQSKMIQQRSEDKPMCKCPGVYIQKERLFAEVHVYWRCTGVMPTISVFTKDGRGELIREVHEMTEKE
jgi:hypothetical protein